MLFRSFFGVGLDSYGDWYRVSRTATAAARFGGSAVSNSAHNVFIDIAATSGLFAFLIYLLIICLALRSSWRILKRTRTFNPIFVGIFTAWIAYLAQSTISINNLALAVWGWILPGMIIAIERSEKVVETPIKFKKVNRQKLDFSSLLMTVGITIGLALGYIPFDADANFRHALESGDGNKIYAAAIKWPTDISRILYAAKIFESNKMPEKALRLTQFGVENYPRSFDGWLGIYNSTLTSAEKKQIALLKIRELDPHNTQIK